MRLALLSCALLAGAIACGTNEPLGPPCTVSANCDVGQVCVDGACVKDPASVALPIGEGEGAGSEGEGGKITPGEGEGGKGDEGEGVQFGEGEGSAASEGEGAAGEGEGAGAGEGEGAGGEGEGAPPPPVCSPGCGSFMTCVQDDVCQPNANTDACNVLATNPGGSSIDFSANQTNDTIGTQLRYDFALSGVPAVDAQGNATTVTESYDSFWLTRVTALIRPKMFVHYTAHPVTAGLDVVFMAVDATGQCGVEGFSDFAGPNGDESFDIDYAQSPTNLVIAAGTCDRVDGGNCFPGVAGGNVLTGGVQIKADGILCPTATLGATNAGNAADDVAADQTTYDECFRALFEVQGTTNTCSNSNPCARDANNHAVGKFCCLKTNCGHNHGDPIKLVTDSATGPCHGF